jgi:hypothetical protein
MVASPQTDLLERETLISLKDGRQERLPIGGVTGETHPE